MCTVLSKFCLIIQGSHSQALLSDHACPTDTACTGDADDKVPGSCSSHPVSDLEAEEEEWHLGASSAVLSGDDLQLHNSSKDDPSSAVGVVHPLAAAAGLQQAAAYQVLDQSVCLCICLSPSVCLSVDVWLVSHSVDDSLPEWVLPTLGPALIGTHAAVSH